MCSEIGPYVMGDNEIKDVKAVLAQDLPSTQFEVLLCWDHGQGQLPDRRSCDIEIMDDKASILRACSGHTWSDNRIPAFRADIGKSWYVVTDLDHGLGWFRISTMPGGRAIGRGERRLSTGRSIA